MMMMPDVETVRTYKIAQAARILGIGRNQCYLAVARGDLPSIRLGGRLLIPRAALDRLLDNGNNKQAVA